jgi:hypothetical protein
VLGADGGERKLVERSKLGQAELEGQEEGIEALGAR